MPIYMDRHDVSEEVTAENVAQLDQADLKIQHQFNCRGLTYWFDSKRKTAFCLIDAPNKDKDLYESENLNIPIDEKFVHALNPRTNSIVKTN